MSKVHEDNAGYVGVSYEETQDPFYSYNKLSLPLSESDKSVIREEVTHTVTQAGSKFVIDGTSQKAVSLAEGGVYTFDQSNSSNSSHPLRFSEYEDGTWGDKFGIFNGTDSRYLREGSGNLLSNNQSVTVEGHIKPNTNVIRGFFDGGSGTGSIIRNYGGNTFAKQSQESDGAVIPTSEVKVGEWQHLAVTFRAGANNALQIWVFIDGVRVATGGLTGGYTGGPTFDIGTINQGGDGKFDGLIRNFRVTFGTLYPYNFTAPAYTSDLTSTAASFEIPSVWGQLNTNSYADALAQVNPRQMPFTLPAGYDCLDFECVPNGSTTADFTVEFGSTGASYDAYYYDTSNNWQSLGSFTNAANTSRTFTPGATFKGIRLYSTSGDLGQVVVENAYYETGTASARLLTMVTSLTDTSGSGRGLTNNDVVLGPIEYTTGVTATGTPGQAGAQTEIVVPFGAPDLYYYCSQHSGMGSSAVTPANAFMFDGALPILTTADSLGTIAQYTVSGGAFNAGAGLGNIFDGSTSTEANHSGGASDTFTLTFSPKVQVSTSLQVYLASGSSKFSVNGGSQTTVSSGSWTSLSFTGELETLAVQGNSTGNYAPRLAGIRVDGKDLGCGAADPYAANLVLALPMNGTNNDTTFTDSSATIRGSGSPKTISRNGNTKISTAQSIFYGSSAEFDGSNDNLKLPANDSDFQFGSGDFTIETWFRPDSTSRMAIYHGSDGDDHSIGIDYSYITQTIAIWASSNGTSWDMADGDSAANRGSIFVPTGVWTHIAYVRYGTKLRLYINGLLDKEFTNSNSIVTETEAPVIGEWYNAGYDLDGYLADFRIYKGVAKYTSEFFVPTPVDALDRSGNSNNASHAGATWQTSVSKFYGGAADVSDGIITVPQNQDLRVSGSNFTAECWVYADTAPSGGTAIFNHWGWSSDRRSWTLQGFTGGEVRFYTSTNGQNTTNVYIGTTMPVGQWFHLAGVVEGTTMRMYVNGSLIGSTSTNNNDVIYDNTTAPIVIGDFSIPTGTRFDGKVQDCKLYKGVAKYTSSSFTPPERSVQGTARRYPSGIYVVS